MNKADKYLREFLDSLAISSPKEAQQYKIQDVILCVEDIKSKWRSILTSMFDFATVEILTKQTKPTHIENQTLYIAVQQADEQFFLTLNEKKNNKLFKYKGQHIFISCYHF